MKYIIIPFLSWIIAGSCKFIINYFRFGKKANKLIGYGGFPSTHITIVSSAVFLYGIENGIENGIFSIAMAFLLITIIDAHGLRRKIGSQAKVINRLQTYQKIESPIILRERMGHTWFEILGGLILGIIIAYCMSRI